MKVEVVIGDIASQPDFDEIVNSTNGNLRLGSGVAGAIHTAAGPELEEYCQQFAPLPHGQAIITPGFKLPNKWVIHTRPTNYLLDKNAEDILKQCLGSVFEVAKQYMIKSLALPAIGTGEFNFPVELVAQVIASAIKIQQGSDIVNVRICVANQATQLKFSNEFSAIGLIHAAIQPPAMVFRETYKYQGPKGPLTDINDAPSWFVEGGRNR